MFFEHDMFFLASPTVDLKGRLDSTFFRTKGPDAGKN
jgi:hypothetical protein